jgi:membrane-bound metal-dependent hydrolase YbcI (DUF457 family)
LTRGTHQIAAFAAALGTLALAHPLLAGSPNATTVPEVVGRVAAPLGLPVAGPLPWPVATVYLLFALLGGLAPDLDKPTGLWNRLLANVVLGGHRHLSHSLVGAAVAAAIVGLGLSATAPLFAFPVGLLWLGFVAGYLSHLAADSLTHEGVPLLFPWGFYFGLPPWSRWRIRTGGWIEQLVVSPALLTFVGWLGYRHGDLLTALWR